MHYYLGPHVLTMIGEQRNFVAPGGGRGALAVGSALHDEGKSDHRGLSVFWTDEPLKELDWLHLGSGDCRELQPDESARDGWQQLTGYRPQGSTLAAWMMDALTVGADPAREAAQAPLVPRHDGTLEVVLADHGQVISRKFKWGSDSHTNKLRTLLRRHLNEYRGQASRGEAISPRTKQADSDWHRKCAKALLEKYGVPWESLKPAEWDAEETPLKHETTITDAFTNTDGTALNSHSAGGFSWGGSTSGHTAIYSNRCRHDTFSNTLTGSRAESNLSSAATYAKLTVKTYTDGAANHQVGPCTRFTSSTITGYTARVVPFHSPDQFELSTISSWSPTQIAVANITLAADDVLQISSDGSTHKAYQNGTERTSATNATYSSGTRTGFFIFRGNSAVVDFDNFEAGDWPIAAGFNASWASSCNQIIQGTV
jgi:hypothetical protein